ncbi:MAG TPA: ATPase, partial [Casimicrobiaceae bacterium]|nr:ATPase [Casimicrobiaceae bacterium]
MSEASITRAAVLEMKDEQRAMHEGYVFLDEKCLLLGGEILRELARYADVDHSLVEAQRAATAALQAAVVRHGLEDLQI